MDVIFDKQKVWKWSDKRSERPTYMIRNLNPGTHVVAQVEEGELRRSHRERQLPTRMQDQDLTDAAITKDGGIVHFALYAVAEPVKVEDAIKDPKLIDSMKEELKSIRRIKHGSW